MRHIKKKIFIILVSITIVLTTTILSFNSKDKSNLNAEAISNGRYVFNKDLISFKRYNIDIENLKIRVYIESDNRVETVPLEDYVVGVVSAEMPAAFEVEALKSQAVAARTYVLSKVINNSRCNKSDNIDICNTVHCQAYKNTESAMSLWRDNDKEMYMNKIRNAVLETKSEVIIYGDDIITNAQYFATSSGQTENSVDVFGKDLPYLRSVTSIGDESAPKYTSNIKYTYKEFVNKLKGYNSNINVTTSNVRNKTTILSRTEGGSVNEIKVGDLVIKGTDFRKIMNLNSANFNIQFLSNEINIEVKGYGHGVGLSQWGANGMAKGGSNYIQILAHYYTGTNINKIKN